MIKKINIKKLKLIEGFEIIQKTDIIYLVDLINLRSIKFRI